MTGTGWAMLTDTTVPTRDIRPIPPVSGFSQLDDFDYKATGEEWQTLAYKLISLNI
jgi:hypothetical protein